jgi:hypothetical protein
MLRHAPEARPSCRDILDKFTLLRKFRFGSRGDGQKSDSSALPALTSSSPPRIYPCMAALVAAAACSPALAEEVRSLADCISISPERLRRQQDDEERGAAAAGLSSSTGSTPSGRSPGRISIPPAGHHQSNSASNSSSPSPQHMSLSEVLQNHQHQQMLIIPSSSSGAPAAASSTNTKAVKFATSVQLLQPSSSSEQQQQQPRAASGGNPLLGTSQRESHLLQHLIAETTHQSSNDNVAVSALEIANRHGTAIGAATGHAATAAPAPEAQPRAHSITRH